MHISLDSALGQQRRLNQVGESITQIAPDPAAAYSLRSLTGGDPKVVRVRRGSDNHEQDFTASEVSSGALTSFVNAQVVAPLDIQALSATGRDGDFLIAKAAYSLRSLGTRQATIPNDAAPLNADTVVPASGKYVVQVRRSSDDTIKSFTATEVTDGTLLSFVGTGGSDNGFVRTWYDQSVSDQAGAATGNHATQTTAAEQPKIVDAGSLLNELDFDGTDDTLAINFGADLSQANSLFMVHQSDTTTSSLNEFFDSASGASPRTLLDQSGSNYRMLGASSVSTGVAVTTDKSLIFALYNGASSLFAKNGTATSALNAGTADINQNSTLGSSGSRFYDGSMQEFIIYNSDQTDNRTAIEANIGEVYSIDLPSGVDPGFDQVDGFVETWYDQSGNVPPNDAVQTTASLQPKIVDAGSLITMNGKPAFLFTSSSSSYFNMTSELSGISDFSTFFVSEVVDRSGRGILVAKDSQNYLRMNDATFQFEASNTDSGAINFNSTLTDGGQFSLAFIRASNTLTAYVAGSAQSNTVSNSDNFAINKLLGRDVNFQTWINKAQELIFYTSDQTANVSTLNTNMASHYEIS